MYPYDFEEELEDLDVDEEEPEELPDAEQEEESEPAEYGVDFSTGMLTGGIVTGAAALRVWAWNALQIARYRFEPFTDDYGNEIETLIGQVDDEDYLAEEAQRMIEEALTVNPNISGIENFEFEKTGIDSARVAFAMVTDYGVEMIEDEFVQ